MRLTRDLGVSRRAALGVGGRVGSMGGVLPFRGACAGLGWHARCRRIRRAGAVFPLAGRFEKGSGVRRRWMAPACRVSLGYNGLIGSSALRSVCLLRCICWTTPHRTRRADRQGSFALHKVPAQLIHVTAIEHACPDHGLARCRMRQRTDTQQVYARTTFLIGGRRRFSAPAPRCPAVRALIEETAGCCHFYEIYDRRGEGGGMHSELYLGLPLAVGGRYKHHASSTSRCVQAGSGLGTRPLNLGFPPGYYTRSIPDSLTRLDGSCVGRYSNLG